jgi:hypothetical protein
MVRGVCVVPEVMGLGMSDEAPEDDLGTVAGDMIRQRILHALFIYPKLSMSMLQIGIGTGFPPALWHPVLERMIENGEVVRTQVQAQNPVSKRDQTYTILQLGSIASSQS